MKQTITLALLLSAFTFPLIAQSSLPADTAHFVINQGSHAVGRTDFSIQRLKQAQIATPAAYTISSHGTLTVPNTSYSFSETSSLDSSLALLQANLNGTVNSQAVTFAVHPSGQNFVIDISANGRPYRNSLNRPAKTVFFPDFDLSAYEILLTLKSSQPASALIPKQTGILLSANLAPQADVQGTFAGQTLTLHHGSLTLGSVTSEIYYAADNRIFEVDLPSQTFAIVRDKFQLQQPPPPPPNQSDPNAQPQANQPQ